MLTRSQAVSNLPMSNGFHSRSVARRPFTEVATCTRWCRPGAAGPGSPSTSGPDQPSAQPLHACLAFSLVSHWLAGKLSLRRLGERHETENLVCQPCRSMSRLPIRWRLTVAFAVGLTVVLTTVGLFL